ncbi:MAG: hydrogenase maturation nickel metallochaperone HypA [Chloroflexi bacterium]|nr:hydrogenase maturation nickel metallochaperone HypA [Chloroflexota bacterium]
MHELSITQEMVKIVVEQAEKSNLTKITKINLVVGDLTGYAGDSIQFYFDFMSKGTVAEGAELVSKKIKGTFTCLKCDKLFKLSEFSYVCPYCQGDKVKLSGGNELFVESIEGE